MFKKSRKIFNLQQLHTQLLILGKEVREGTTYDIINCVMNKLNLLFTNYFKNIPFNVINIFQQEYSKYNIQYIPSFCHLSALVSSNGHKQEFINNINIAQKGSLTYFKNVYINSTHIKAINKSDLLNIIKDLDYKIRQLAKSQHIILCSCAKIPLINKIRLYLQRNVHTFSVICYLFIIVVFISALFFIIVFGSASCDLRNTSSYKNNYSIIAKNPKRYSNYRETIRNNTNMKHYRGYKNFNRICYKSNLKCLGIIDESLPKYVQSNIMTYTINYSFWAATIVYVLLFLYMIIYFKIYKLRKLNLKRFLAKISKMFSCQIISGISIYAIILNFVDNAFKEPPLIINVIMGIMIIMYVAFFVDTISELYCMKR